MKEIKRLVSFSLENPRLITGAIALLTLFLALLALLPTMWPKTFSALNAAKIDTDPENMLPKDEGARVFHHDMKKALSLYDMLVVGVLNERNPEGVFNPESLSHIWKLSEYAKSLQWPEDKSRGAKRGVISRDILSLSTVDDIKQAGEGAVSFDWLMSEPPKTKEEALEIRKRAMRIPLLNGTVVSEDGKAAAIYLPLSSKNISHKVATALRKKISAFSGEDRFYITGLPVAEDTFGIEMFSQMMISAPLAMLVIFLLMLYFFKKPLLIIPPLVVAFLSVACTMSLLVLSGNTIHIMSSMIPIFIMPIAVLDAIHILSEFYDRYRETCNRKIAISGVMDTLFSPMLFTSLTTTAGFASLALTPIPPVQVFGIFVAIGVMAAWLFTITLIPASVMFLPERGFDDFGASHESEGDTAGAGVLGVVGRWVHGDAKAVVLTSAVLLVVSLIGIGRIRINDNPTKWFSKKHEIRIADKVLNDHFAGTYMAYLAIRAKEPTGTKLAKAADSLLSSLESFGVSESGESFPSTPAWRKTTDTARALVGNNTSFGEFFSSLYDWAEKQSDSASFEESAFWDTLLEGLDRERQSREVFKRPDVLRYISGLQDHLRGIAAVGKSNSLSDIVKTVHRELLLGKNSEFRIPDSSEAVGQTLMTFQNSHRPQDLFHFVTPDFRTTSLWLQLKSGDNRDMEDVVKNVENYFASNPTPPSLGLEHRWFGLTYINVVWQDKMVSGMLESFLGSFLVVLLMMIFLFRSALWGILSMIPLTLTIAFIYGVIGFVGKDYDMPVAVLSSLSLGLAVDYAIHFLARSREIRREKKDWGESINMVFGEPVRAILKNVVVVSVGFLPLLLSGLVPYRTVGIFIAAILFTAGIVSVLLLPALITLLEKQLFPRVEPKSVSCNAQTCAVASLSLVGLVAVNLHQFEHASWGEILPWALLAVAVLVLICRLAARRYSCKD